MWFVSFRSLTHVTMMVPSSMYVATNARSISYGWIRYVSTCDYNIRYNNTHFLYFSIHWWTFSLRFLIWAPMHSYINPWIQISLWHTDFHIISRRVGLLDHTVICRFWGTCIQRATMIVQVGITNSIWVFSLPLCHYHISKFLFCLFHKSYFISFLLWFYFLNK